MTGTRPKLKRGRVAGLDCYEVYDRTGVLVGFVRKRTRRCRWGHALKDEESDFLYDCETRADAVAALVGWGPWV